MGSRCKKLIDVLIYQLKFGKYEEGILREAEKNNTPVPEKVLNAPQLKDGLGIYLEAFAKLSSDRSYGFGIGPIPFSSIYNYARIVEIDNQDIDTFINIIQKMDAAFIDYQEKENKKNQKASKPKIGKNKWQR